MTAPGGYHLSEFLRQLRTSRHRGLAAVITLALVSVGLIGAAAGTAWSAVAFAAAVATGGAADRRGAPLLTLVLLPGLTLFHDLEAARIDGSILDFRLILTGGIAVALATWVVLERAWPDRLGWILVAFVALQAALAPTSDAGLLRALPTVARAADVALAYMLARRVFDGPAGMALPAMAVVLGGVVPIVSGLAEWLAGTAVLRNDALRVAGVYGSSPVGLALMMLLVGLLAAAIAIGSRTAIRPTTRRISGVVALLAAFVLLETATRLAFVAFVASLGLVELLRREERRVAGALLVVIPVLAIGLAAQPDLLARIVSTGTEAPSPTATAPVESSPTPPAGESAVPGASPEPLPSATAPPDPAAQTRGDTSLRFRVFVWSTMVRAWADAPLLGHGPGSFATILEERTGLERIAPHNDYLGVAVESGVTGLALFVAAQLMVVLMLLRARARGAMPVLLAATVASVIGINVLNAINNPMYYLDLQVAIWSIVGAGVGAAARSREGGHGP